VVKSTLLALGGVFVVGVVATGIWAWTPDKSRISLREKYDDSFTRYAEMANTSVRFRVTGAPDAPAIILIHGFASSLETWESWANDLSKTYRVVRLDMPGCGLSDPDRTGNYADAHSLEIVRQLMEVLNINEAVLMGNSMGGRIAWQFAAQFPARVRKLVLISPDGFASPGFAYGKPAQVPVLLGFIKYFLPRLLMRMNLASAYADPARLTDATVNRYYDLLLASGNRGAMLDRLRQTVLENPVPILAKISAPTLLLWGEKDRLIPFTNSVDYLSALPNASLVSFSDLGHVPHEESPVESLQPLLRFLAQ
jgi:pimeloyl-ACP methyl ester carboxylesterase